MANKDRIAILDVLTLMATVLVVMGHHKFLRPVVDWYATYDKIIYSFHMGFFMTLSGFLVRYTFPSPCRWKDYVGKKAKKFIPAYLVVGLLAALISYTSLSQLGCDLLMLIVNPTQGPIQIIWYIYVLLLYYALAPLIFKLSAKGRWYLFGVSVVAATFYTYLPGYLCLNHFVRLMPFFLFGSILCDNRERIQTIPDKYLLILSIPFIANCTVNIFMHENMFPGGLGLFVSSMIALPFMYWIARKLMHCPKVVDLSQRLSGYVFPIYLWQMFFINAWALMLNKLHLTLTNGWAVLYLILSVTLTIAGIVIMVRIYRYFIKKIFHRL